MKIEIYSEGTRQLLFTLFDSKKNRKTNAFRVHKHPELELGYITGGSGDYILENRTYRAKSGDLFLVCPNEQHFAGAHELQYLLDLIFSLAYSLRVCRLRKA